MKKLPDWVARLEQAFKEAKFKDFNWGTFNCCTFTADCVVAQTGEDPMEEMRPRFEDKRSAYRFLKELSGGSLAKAAEDVAAKYDMKEVAPAYVQRGDMVIAKNEDGEEIFAIIDLSGRWVIGVRPDTGLCHEELTVIERAWRLG